MKHTENEYIQAGFDFEKGRKPAQSLRVMIEAEDIDDRAEVRRLVEQGRAEARKQSRNSDGKKTMKNELFNVWADGQLSLIHI